MASELTPEERTQMRQSGSLCYTPETRPRIQVGDAVPCPRCHRGAVMHNSTTPCVSCQLKESNARIAELETLLSKAAEVLKAADKLEKFASRWDETPRRAAKIELDCELELAELLSDLYEKVRARRGE